MSTWHHYTAAVIVALAMALPTLIVSIAVVSIAIRRGRSDVDRAHSRRLIRDLTEFARVLRRT